jgi:hypothetical protein
VSKTIDLETALGIVERVDAYLDSSASPEYRAQPLAQDWARVTKVCEEAGEVWQEQSRRTGENSRKGQCGSDEELIAELADTVSAGMCAIQHVTKDPARTWAIVAAALLKANSRIAPGGYVDGQPAEEGAQPVSGGELCDFAWNSGHPAFRKDEALAWLEANIPDPWWKFAYRVEFFGNGLHDAEGVWVRVHRFAIDPAGSRFICGHGMDGAERHAARLPPKSFKVSALPPEELR